MCFHTRLLEVHAEPEATMVPLNLQQYRLQGLDDPFARISNFNHKSILVHSLHEMSLTTVTPGSWLPYGRNDPFRWQTLPYLWPRRLLHIPTMTSIERQPGNIYGSVREPEYGILTYTWGRWQTSNGPSLNVSGITWDIPAVNEEAFTLRDVQNVLNTISQDTEFVWIDVACIDQENYTVKMDEAGRQGGIFANAKYVYVWLWTLSLASLEAAMGDVVYCSMYLVPDFRNEIDRDLISVLTELQKSIDTLLGDWWFSSLWTLQEGFLRRDAMVLSREGGPVPYGHTKPASHLLNRYISSSLGHVRAALEDPYSRFTEPSLVDISDLILRSITKAGYGTYPFMRNPNIQYGAARFRVASDELDKIYGIISLYNIKVGATRDDYDKSRPYTFEKLQEEFAAVLNSTSPLLGQMFIHLEEPRRTWQITQNIRVPGSLGIFIPSENFAACQISADSDGCAHVKGKLCPFTQFHPHDISMNERDSWPYGGPFSYFSIIPDDYVPAKHVSVPLFPETFSFSSEEKRYSRETAAALLQEFPAQQLSVFLLGHQISGSERQWSALLLQHKNGFGRECRRLGICIWTLKQAQPDIMPSISHWQWNDFEGRMY